MVHWLRILTVLFSHSPIETKLLINTTSTSPHNTYHIAKLLWPLKLELDMGPRLAHGVPVGKVNSQPCHHGHSVHGPVDKSRDLKGERLTFVHRMGHTIY